MSGDPYPKSVQLARGERRYHRKVAGPKRWQQIIDAKIAGRPCRVCPSRTLVDPAHLIGRGQGGPDSEWNVIPLCRIHHAAFDAHNYETCRAVCASLTDQEYAGLVEFAGEGVFESRFKIRYERVA